MALVHTSRRLVRVYSSLFNLEIGLAGFIGAFLVLVINWAGTGYIAWHAALFKLAVSTGFNLVFPKVCEHVTRRVHGWWRRQLWANIVPNTAASLVLLSAYLLLGIPRPLLSVWPFWLIAMVNFTQIVKYSKDGYEPGFFDIVHGLWEDLRGIRSFIAGKR